MNKWYLIVKDKEKEPVKVAIGTTESTKQEIKQQKLQEVERSLENAQKEHEKWKQ